MIRTQLLLWLVALGWASEAGAAIKLTLKHEYSHGDTVFVREDAGETEIEVTATKVKTVEKDTYVTLSIEGQEGCDSGLNSRYRITLPTLIIPAGESEATGTIIFIPIDDKLKGNDEHDEGEEGCDDSDENKSDEGDDLVLQITGNAGGTHAVTTESFLRLIDDDKASTRISLWVSQSSLSKEAGATDIVVTAKLNGKELSKSLTFNLGIAESKSNHAVRDIDYTVTNLGRITIPKNKASGQTTITIIPKNKGTGTIQLVGQRSSNSELDGIPLNVIDLDGDPNTTKRGDRITIGTQQIKLTNPPPAAIKGLTARPNTIREDQGPTNIALTVELQDALAADAEVSFTFAADVKDIRGNDALNELLDDAEPAVRDAHYTATIDRLIIRQGEAVGTTTLTLTPIDNERVNSAKAFKLRAAIGTAHLIAGIKITDDDTASRNIMLEVSHNELREDAGETDITVTATLDGKVLEKDITVLLVLDVSAAATATHDIDYTALLRSVPIPAGQAQGVQTISITPKEDGIEDADEKIILKALKNPKNDDNKEIAVGTATITLKDTSPRAPASPTGDTIPAFVENQPDISVAVGKPMRPLELPLATGDGDLTYSVSNTLPAGLSFDRATQTIEGTPTTVETATIIYTVIDGDEAKPESVVMIFKIAVVEAPPPVVAVASVTSTHSSLREDGETTEITLTATLAAPAPEAETVRFTIVAPTQGIAAVRDVDYSAALEALVPIAADATQATTTLRLTPFDNDAVNGNAFLGVQATASGGSAQTDIKITDDETPSTSIVLSVSPHTVREDAEQTEITVTATLDGQALAQDATVTLSIDDASSAQRDLDYSAVFNPMLVIPANSIAGAVSLFLDPIDDGKDEGNETIVLNSAIEGLAGDSTTITLTDASLASAKGVSPPPTFESHNYPNPFNPTTTIQYALPTATDVELTVYNAVGQAVRTLVAEHQRPGYYAVEWDATDASGHSVSAGIYFYCLRAGGQFLAVEKMLLLK